MKKHTPPVWHEPSTLRYGGHSSFPTLVSNVPFDIPYDVNTHEKSLRSFLRNDGTQSAKRVRDVSVKSGIQSGAREHANDG